MPGIYIRTQDAPELCINIKKMPWSLLSDVLQTTHSTTSNGNFSLTRMYGNTLRLKLHAVTIDDTTITNNDDLKWQLSNMMDAGYSEDTSYFINILF